MKPKCQNSGIREAPRSHLLLGNVILQKSLRGNEYERKWGGIVGGGILYSVRVEFIRQDIADSRWVFDIKADWPTNRRS
jgi:hypothetical protein